MENTIETVEAVETAELPKKKRRWYLIPLILLLCAIAITIAIFALNEYSLVLNIPEETI